MMGILFLISAVSFIFCSVIAAEINDTIPTIIFTFLAVLSLIGTILAGNQLDSNSDKKCNSNIVVYQICEVIN